jgi:hypothetical protein
MLVGQDLLYKSLAKKNYTNSKDTERISITLDGALKNESITVISTSQTTTTTTTTSNDFVINIIIVDPIDYTTNFPWIGCKYSRCKAIYNLYKR